ncbi:MAG: type II secretion system protein GspK [Phycisphaerales bacterium]
MSRRRGSVVVVVVWAIAIASVLVAATQIVSFRQAVVGRESLARVQARWAARAGVEQMIATMEYHTLNPDPDDPMAVVRDMEDHALGETETGTWDIHHSLDGQDWAGPMDEAAKLNLNTATRAQLLNIPHMTPDVVDAIMDWRDADDEVQGMGAEKDYYANRSMGYRPRNGPFKSFREVELVAGAWPEYVRGEDWNLNGRLDPNEDDGPRTFPDDKPDGKLDAGWSQYLTAYSVQSPNALSGEPKLALKSATQEDLIARTGVDEAQARALGEYGRTSGARPENLLITPLSQTAGARSASSSGSQGGSSGGRSSGGGMSSGGSKDSSSSGGSKSGGSSGGASGATSGRSSAGRGNATSTPAVKDLNDQQLRAVLRETTADDFSKPVPGRININTASADLLKNVLDIDARVADTIVARRRAKREGITSLVDLMGLSGLNSAALGQIATQFDVTSSVYTVTSRGRAASTGVEVEIEAVVDRSVVPARILSYREQ